MSNRGWEKSPPAERPAIIGVGNILMGDEGVGVRIAQLLQEKFKGLPADVYDVGTGISGIFNILQNRSLALILDCAYMDEPPGQLRWFTPSEIQDRKPDFRWSLHHGSLLESLELAARLGCAPQRMLIAGIQPHTVKPGTRLSPQLEAELENYAREVSRKLEQELSHCRE